MKLSIEQPLLNSAVGVNTTVAQKWPVRPILVHTSPVDFANHNFFPIARTFRDDLAVGSADKTLSPKFNPVAASWCFVTDTIRRRYVAAVRDRVTALNCFPGRMLRRARFFFLARMPADRRRIKNNLGATQCRQPCCFGIPLVPANADTDLATLCFPRLKTEVARREIKLLVIQRIVRDVHLAIFPEKFSVRVNNCGRVVINARPAFLEKRRDNRDAELARQFRQRRCRSSGNFFGQFEVFVVFGLAKILRAKKFRQTNNRGVFFSGGANEIERPGEILVRIRAASHLNKRDLGHVCLSHSANYPRRTRSSRRCNYFRPSCLSCSSWWSHFTESAGTMSIFSITTRVVGLLFSPMLFLVTGVSPIFASTSSPLINLPKVVYW